MPDNHFVEAPRGRERDRLDAEPTFAMDRNRTFTATSPVPASRLGRSACERLAMGIAIRLAEGLFAGGNRKTDKVLAAASLFAFNRIANVQGDAIRRLMQTHLALLRGINVGGHRKVPMAELRTLAEQAGYAGVRTYIASGNLVLESALSGSAIEADLEQAIEKCFGFHVDVVVRSRKQWKEYLRTNPFLAESKASPNLVMICVGKESATEDDRRAFAAMAGGNERVERSHDVLWLYFGNGSARSKLGSGRSKEVWTTRNWTTVQRLAAIMDG